jgi:hypothetical protein
MLPVVAVVAVCVFLVLHFTGVLDDLGQRGTRRAKGDPRVLESVGPRTREKEMDRRLKVFESFISNLARPDEEEDDEPGSVRQDNSSND